jgi:hypothetical protein
MRIGITSCSRRIMSTSIKAQSKIRSHGNGGAWTSKSRADLRFSSLCWIWRRLGVNHGRSAGLRVCVRALRWAGRRFERKICDSSKSFRRPGALGAGSCGGRVRYRKASFVPVCQRVVERSRCTEEAGICTQMHTMCWYVIDNMGKRNSLEGCDSTTELLPPRNPLYQEPGRMNRPPTSATR